MKYIVSALLTLSTTFLCAQGEPTCYQQYAKVFEVRGADEVKDGTHNDVIITIRKGSFADCFVGKVKVHNGIIDPNSIALSFVDNSYEPFRRSYKYEDPMTIVNGISKTMVTNDEELINVMFVDAIKPKRKAYKRAPDPTFDL
jgi:hypothetical protein